MPEPNQDTKLVIRKHAPLIIAVAGVLLLLVVVALLIGEKNQNKPPAEPEQATQAAAPHKKPGLAPPLRADHIEGTLLVNGGRAMSLPSDAPVYVQCLLSDPLTKAIPLALRNGLAPRVNGAADVRWRPVPPPATEIAPKGVLPITWIAESGLPPGEYRITLANPVAGVRVRIEPARVTISVGAGDPEVVARHRRRVLMIEGKADQALSAIDKAVAAAPADLNLLRERVDALEVAGRRKDAHQQILQLAMRLQEHGPAPDWLVFREMQLRATKETTE